MSKCPEIFLLFLFVLFSGCSSDEATPDKRSLLNGPCPPGEALGALEINVVSAFSAISGTFADSIVPSAVAVLEMEEEYCSLWRRPNPECIPPCGSGQTCDFDGNCVPYPVQQDAGVISIRGLSEPVSLSPMAPTNSYSKVDISHPAFTAGDAITMTSTDGYFGILRMKGTGVDQLVSSDMVWPITRGKSLNVAWDAPTVETGAKIQLRLNINQHGASPLTLICDFPDTGSAQVSTLLMDTFINTGVSGIPNGRLVRWTVDSMEVEKGCVEFRISSSLNADVQLAIDGP